MSEMGVDIFKNNLSNVQRAYLWEVLVPNVIGGGDSDVILLRAQSTSIPGRSVGAIHIPFKQSPGMKYPGKLTYAQTWDCTFVEGEDKKVFAAIHAWNQQVVDDFDNVGKGDIAIKSAIYLTMLSTAGDSTLKIKLVGCYPQEVGDVALAYGDEGPVNFPCTWSFDRWEEVR